MPRLEARVEINHAPGEVFEIVNDIDKWSVLFNEYTYARVTKREEAGRFTKLVFQLRNKEGMEWQSWRILDHQELVAIAERDTPLFPFKYMHLKWTCVPSEHGTLMTWTQDFEMDPAVGVPMDRVIEVMDKHGVDNQTRIKELIESGAVTVHS